MGERGSVVEAVVAAGSARASCWPGTGGQGGGIFASGSRAEHAAGLTRWKDPYDLACMRWACGSGEPGDSEHVWVVLFQAAAAEKERSARDWPHGMMQALTALAMLEIQAGGGRWSGERRRGELGAMGPSMGGWSQTWGRRYEAILDAGVRAASRGMELQRQN